MAETIPPKNIQAALEIADATARYVFSTTPGVGIERTMIPNSWSPVQIRNKANHELIAEVWCEATAPSHMSLKMYRFQNMPEAGKRFDKVVAESAKLSEGQSRHTEETERDGNVMHILESQSLDGIAASVNRFLAAEQDRGYKGKLISAQGAALTT